MAERKAAIVNYQQRAAEFSVGNSVSLFDSTKAVGKVVAVYEAIGMVDVEWPTGSQRLPVEDLQLLDADTPVTPPKSDNVPGGANTVMNPRTGRVRNPRIRGGSVHCEFSPRRIAEAYVKRAMYWAAPDRKYRASQGEINSGQFLCPKCKDAILKPASYKREGGASIRLLGCGNCLFLIRTCDLMGHPEYEEASVSGGTI